MSHSACQIRPLYPIGHKRVRVVCHETTRTIAGNHGSYVWLPIRDQMSCSGQEQDLILIAPDTN
jgi:hypothetical protein